MTHTLKRPSMADNTVTSRDRGDLWRYSGLGFAITFMAGFVIWSLPPYPYGSTLAEWGDALAGDTRDTWTLLSSHLVLPLASVLAIATVAYLRRAVGRALAGPSVALDVALGAAITFGIGFQVVGAGSHATRLTGGGEYIDGFPAVPETAFGLSLLTGNVGNATIFGAAIVLLTVGAAAWRSRALPRWLVWAGFVTAPALVAAWYYGLPVVLFCLWMAIAPLMVRAPTAAD